MGLGQGDIGRGEWGEISYLPDIGQESVKVAFDARSSGVDHRVSEVKVTAGFRGDSSFVAELHFYHIVCFLNKNTAHKSRVTTALHISHKLHDVLLLFDNVMTTHM